MYSPPSITGGILGVECEDIHKDLGTQKTEGKDGGLRPAWTMLTAFLKTKRHGKCIKL